MGKRESLGCRILRHIRPSKRSSHVRILAMTSSRNHSLTDAAPFDATLMNFGFGPDERLGVLVVLPGLLDGCG